MFFQSDLYCKKRSDGTGCEFLPLSSRLPASLIAIELRAAAGGEGRGGAGLTWPHTCCSRRVFGRDRASPPRRSLSFAQRSSLGRLAASVSPSFRFLDHPRARPHAPEERGVRVAATPNPLPRRTSLLPLAALAAMLLLARRYAIPPRQ